MSAKSLSKLPRSDEVWEIGMIHAEHRTQGVDLVGLLLVVERTSGAIRVAEAVVRGESPAVVLRAAFVRPAAPSRPGRPKRAVFDDPALQQQVAPLLAEAQVLSVSAEATPALDDAIARVLGKAGAAAAPGIDSDLSTWRVVLASLIRLAPWTRLDDHVEFTFDGAGLEGAVGTVMGAGGRIPGVRLHASMADLQRHRDAALAPTGRVIASSLHVMLEPRSGLSAEEVERCLRAGLQFVPGLYPRVYAVDGGALRPATPTEQGRMLIAVRAVTALCERDLARLAKGQRSTLSLGVDDATVEVTGERAHGA